MPDGTSRGELKLVAGKQGGEIAAKLARLAQLPAKEKLARILSDSRAAELVREIPLLDYYLLVKEPDSPDGLKLLELATPRQFSFLLDLELWDKWSLREGKGGEWLANLAEGGEERTLRLVDGLEAELLVLLLSGEIEVSGGLGSLVTDEDRLRDWDHSFDGVYMVNFRSPKTARAVGALLDTLHRNRPELYTFLMEGVMSETGAELEEVCLQFRTGRMADYGFPEYLDALGIYARVDPDAFTPAPPGKVPLAPGRDHLVLLPGAGASLFRKVLAREGSGALREELRYLVNSAIVAEEGVFDDPERLQGVLQRVDGCLNIALEFLAGDDEERAAEIAAREYLRRLFSLGFSLVRKVAEKGRSLEPEDHPTARLAAGLTRERPLFYRGLDPDGVDGYREFQSLADIRTVAALLEGAS